MKYARALSLATGLVAALLMASLNVVAQQNPGAAVAAVGASGVPRLVNYSGVLNDSSGRTITSITGVTFLLYKDSRGGAPVWMETQSVTPDKTGHFTVQLGAVRSEGLPAEVFMTGEGRWLAVQIAGEAEQPRVLLVAVPYAMKAADADTVGGLPASAFVLAAPAAGSSIFPANNTVATTSGSTPPPVSSNVTTTGGTVNTIPLFTTATNIQNSAITQTGSGTTAKIGIGTSTPASVLDVKGGETVRGALTLPATGAATSTAGKTSQPQDLVASSFSSSASAAVNQTFQWQAEPANNNTANPSGVLSLLYGLGTAKPAETGLRIGPKGIVAFAPGQTFPGTGPGTITGVTAGTDLTGGGTSGKVTLNLDTTQVPQLNTPNSFSQAMAINTSNPFGSLQVTGPAQAIVGTMTTNDFLTPAILGNASATGTGSTIGVEGTTSTASGYGVYGDGGSTGTGVYGNSSGGVGVYGNSTGGGLAGYFNGNVQLTGKVTSYNGIGTVANGVPSIVFQLQSFSAGEGLSTTNLYTPANDGIFRITAFQECNGTSAGNTLFVLAFSWTVPASGSPNTLGYGTVSGGGCGGSFASYASGSVVAHVQGGTAIQYNYPAMDAPFQTTILIEQLL